jgi:cobalt-zinc-cadmium efflux system outer membrane protein
MMRSPILFAALLPLAFGGCTSTNPKGAFEDVNHQIAARTGQEVRWMRDDTEREQIEKTVEGLLRTNLTVQTAVAIALLNNRTLQAQFESLGISQAELAQAARLRNPQFSGFWRFPTHGPTVVNAEYSLAQDFLDLLVLPTRKKIAARHLEGTQLRVAQEVLRLAQEVQVAFYTLQAHQQFVKRLSLIMEVNEAAADIAQRQHDAGNINNLEWQHQQAAFAQSRLDLAKAEAQARADREKLNRLLGLWGQQTGWQMAEALAPVPDGELPLENLEALAVSRRLDLAAARGDVEALASALTLKKNFRYLPGAALGVSAEHDIDRSWVVGPTLDLEVPLFDQGQGEIARLAAEYRRAQRAFEALAVNIRSEVRERRDAVIAARAAAEYHAKILLPQRQSILRETLLQYNAMQLGNYVLLAAKEREQLAEREAIEALRDYWVARAELETAVGGTLTRDVAALSSAPPSAKPKRQETEPPPTHQH